MSDDFGPLVDFHSHLMPGVDDGSRDLGEAMDGIERLIAAGVGRIVTTPHFAGRLTGDPDELDRRLGQLDAAWELVHGAATARWPDLPFDRGVEVLLDDPAVDLSDPRLRLAGTAVVLVEWPGFRVPPHSTEMLAGLVAEGYRPAVAHPERYGGHTMDANLIASWRDVGAFLQVNQGSLCGRYGKKVQAMAETLLELGLVDCLCTDFHGRRGYELLTSAVRTRFQRAGLDEVFVQLAGGNPARILDGGEPIPVGRISLDVGIMSRLRGIFDRGTG